MNKIIKQLSRNQDRVFEIVTWLQAGSWRNLGPILRMGKRLSSFPSRPDRLLLGRFQGLLPGCKEAMSSCCSLIQSRDKVVNECSCTTNLHVPSWRLKEQLYMHSTRYCQTYVGYPWRTPTISTVQFGIEFHSYARNFKTPSYNGYNSQWSCPFQFRSREEASLRCKCFI
jgi:hypothetical protein